MLLPSFNILINYSLFLSKYINLEPQKLNDFAWLWKGEPLPHPPSSYQYTEVITTKNLVIFCQAFNSLSLSIICVPQALNFFGFQYNASISHYGKMRTWLYYVLSSTEWIKYFLFPLIQTGSHNLGPRIFSVYITMAR